MIIKTLVDNREFEFNPRQDGWIPHQYEEIKQYDSFFGFDKEWTAIEVGAGLGLWTMWATPQVKEIYSLEPIRFNDLFRNIKLNHFSKLYNVHAEDLALYSDTGRYPMDVTSLPLASTLIKGAWNDGAEWLYSGKQKMVDTYTWDYFTSKFYIYQINAIHLCKIDVEGAELAILSQMTQNLPERLIIAVYHHPSPFHRIHGVLAEKGYILDGIGYYDKHAKNKGRPHSAFFRREDIPFKTPQRYEMGKWERPNKELLEGGIPYYPTI